MAVLGDLYTKRPSINPANFPNEEFELYSVPAYEREGADTVRGAEIGSTKVSVEPGDVLLCRIVPHIRRSWVVPPETGRRQIASGEWIVLKGDGVVPSYLRHLLLGDGFHLDFMSTVAGVGGSLMRARASHASSIQIPLPPLPEQRRIASILDSVDRLRGHRRLAIAGVHKLIESVFIGSFGDPLESSARSSAQTLESVCIAIVDCPHTTPVWTESGVLCLRTTNLARGEWDFEEQRYVSESTHEVRVKRANLEPGDIVLSREGTIGVGAIVPRGMTASMGQRLVQVRPDKTRILPEYLLSYLLEVLEPSRLTKLLVGSTSLHVNVKDIRQLRIDVPSIHRQARFARTLAQLRGNLDRHRAHLAKLDELFASLQDRAFRGDL